TVTIFLPRSRESLPRIVDAAGPVPHTGKAATVLVVDDDAAVEAAADLCNRVLPVLVPVRTFAFSPHQSEKEPALFDDVGPQTADKPENSSAFTRRYFKGR